MKHHIKACLKNLPECGADAARFLQSKMDQPSHGFLRLVRLNRFPMVVPLNKEKIKTFTGNGCQVDRFP